MDNIYNSDSEKPSDSAFHELICEYVDGTMDEDVEEVFKEWLRQDAEVEAYVRKLKEAHQLLVSCSGRQCTSDEFQSKLRERLELEKALASRISLKLHNKIILSLFKPSPMLLAALLMAFSFGFILSDHITNSSDEPLYAVQSVDHVDPEAGPTVTPAELLPVVIFSRGHITPLRQEDPKPARSYQMVETFAMP